MGVRCLNKFINKNCKKSITKNHLSELDGKILAVDTNIYMYKFVENNQLIEQFYFMISLFKYYNIKPIFVFDGKIDIDKVETINKRRNEKLMAEEKYNNLILENDPKCKMMINLKKKFTYVSRNMFNEVKKLINLMGETYIDAPCEADELCAWLVIKNYVDGCLSEDTDLFVYGCSKVYKGLDLNNQSVIKYDLNTILKIINISKKNFLQLCVISDNDYNDNNKGFIYYYHLYKKTNKYEDFYNWLLSKSYNIDYQKLIKLCDKFKLQKVFDIDVDIKCKNINKDELINFLKTYNFIFI
tara:strand:+ start:1889 stop:2785 length:897 start_codon:yes stop_codon:yes gene_type:complete